MAVSSLELGLAEPSRKPRKLRALCAGSPGRAGACGGTLPLRDDGVDVVLASQQEALVQKVKSSAQESGQSLPGLRHVLLSGDWISLGLPPRLRRLLHLMIQQLLLIFPILLVTM